MNKLILALSLSVCLVACSKKVETPPVDVPASTVATPSVAATVDEGIAAVLRAHPNSRMVCYETKFDGYFLNYGPRLPVGTDDDGQLHGWYLLQHVQLWRSSNDTWFTGEQPDKEYVTVFPEVTGLPCKGH